MPNDKIRDIGEAICKQVIGFLPTSSSIKPLHIANGLFRRCLGECCDISAVHEWVTSERRKNPAILSSEKIKQKYEPIFYEGEQESVDNIASVRFVLEELFDQDKAAFPSLNETVLSISSRWLVKGRVSSEADIDKFNYEILSQKIDSRQSEAIALIKQALKDDCDDLTRLIKPIIIHKQNELRESEREYVTKNEQFSSFNEFRLDICQIIIRKAYDNLVDNMRLTGQDKNSLLVLQRIVNLACFSTIFYLISANNTKHGGERIPLLLDSGIGLASIEYASEECLIAAKKSVEALFINSIQTQLLEEIAHGDSWQECEAYIESMMLDEKKYKSTEVRKELKTLFNSFCADGEGPIRALARALQFCIYTYVYPNCTPSDFCSRGLSVRLGLVGPIGNAVKKKRLLTNRFLLETLTLSVVTEEELREGIEIRELGNRLREMYNIIIGTDAELDYRLLEKSNISQNTPGDLRGELSLNARAIAEMYISMRLAKKYADGVTIISWEG